MSGIVGLGTSGNLIRDNADSVFLQYQEIEVLNGTSKYFIITNITDTPFRILQMSHLSVCPDTLTDGKSHIDIQAYLDVNITSGFTGTPSASAYSNSNVGKTYNIKGLMLDINELASFDTMFNTKYLTLDTDCTAHTASTGLYLPIHTNKDFIKPIYVGPGNQLVLKITNTAIGGTGIDTEIHLTLIGEFMTPVPGLFGLPLTVDTSLLTTDNILITVDQTEL